MQKYSTIRWLGERPGEHYTIIPNSLARCPDITASARSVAMYIWSQAHGFRISERSIADALKMDRKTVGRALDNLQENRWLKLVRQESENGSVRFEYLARRCGPFMHPLIED